MKRTYQPKKRKRKIHGFFSRSKKGKILNERRRKGRWQLTI